LPARKFPVRFKSLSCFSLAWMKVDPGFFLCAKPYPWSTQITLIAPGWVSA
jgi:hypothetical protein